MRCIETDQAGVLVKLGDPQELARGICKILLDGQLAARMSAQCKRIINKYYWGTIIREFVKRMPGIG